VREVAAFESHSNTFRHGFAMEPEIVSITQASFVDYTGLARFSAKIRFGHNGRLTQAASSDVLS
jgi:hypothetical protein